MLAQDVSLLMSHPSCPTGTLKHLHIYIPATWNTLLASSRMEKKCNHTGLVRLLRLPLFLITLEFQVEWKLINKFYPRKVFYNITMTNYCATPLNLKSIYILNEGDIPIVKQQQTDKICIRFRDEKILRGHNTVTWAMEAHDVSPATEVWVFPVHAVEEGVQWNPWAEVTKESKLLESIA